MTTELLKVRWLAGQPLERAFDLGHFQAERLTLFFDRNLFGFQGVIEGIPK